MLSHGTPFKLNTIGFMDQLVQDGIGDSGIVDMLMLGLSVGLFG